MTAKLFAILFSLALSGAVWAANNDAEALSATCAGCHGSEGASKADVPIIGGLSEPYLQTTMKNYKDGSRYATVMPRIAKGYSDQQIAALAEYFSKQPWVPATQKIDAKMATEGQKLHKQKGCAGCHGASGTSASASVPRLSGQYSRYLVYQMQDFRDPDKAIPAAALPMRGMLAGSSDDDLEALAQFYASQK